jgi:hypothetical protein
LLYVTIYKEFLESRNLFIKSLYLFTKELFISRYLLIEMTVIFDDNDEDYFYLNIITLSNNHQESEIANSHLSQLSMQSKQFISNKLDSPICNSKSQAHFSKDKFLKYSIQVVDDYDDDNYYNDQKDFNKNFHTLHYTFENSQLSLKSSNQSAGSNSLAINQNISHIVWALANPHKLFKNIFSFSRNLVLNLIENCPVQRKVFSFWKWIESKLIS